MLRIRCVALFVIVVAASGAAVLAQPATTAPAARTTTSIDHVEDLIDLYLQGAERDRFFAAAGVDGELTKEEFAAAAGKPSSFVRSYDRWASAIVFDRDRDGRLNWVEAEQYRLAIRKEVLALFDLNKDGRLTGPERQAANAYLAAGMGRPKLSELTRPQPPGEEKRPDLDQQPLPDKQGPSTDASWPERWRQLQTRYDADKDGTLSADERFGLYEALRGYYQKRLLAGFDANHNGFLDGDELQAAEHEQRRQADQMRQQWELVRWDANRDGQLDSGERATMEARLAEQVRLAQQSRQEWIKRWDKDGDGELSREERAEITKDLRRRVALQRREMDANGDGKLTGDEIRAYRTKLFEDLRRQRRSATRPAAADEGR